MARKSRDTVVINKCLGYWEEVTPRSEYSRCAGRTKNACETTPSGEPSSCVWVTDPKGPQGSYCRGSSEVVRE